MAGRTKNVNLNKEPFEGYVRHWRRQWVALGDRTKENKGAWQLRLIKWVQTESRVTSGPARHPHIAPVTDLSLVPGARIGGQTAAAAAAATGAPGASAGTAAVGQQSQAPAPAPTATQQQQQQGTPAPAAAAAPHAANQQQQQPGPSAFAGAATAAAAAGDAQQQQQQQQIPRVSSLNALSIDVPASQQDAATAAAAAAAGGGASGPPSFVLPSPSVVTGVAFTYSHLSVGNLQLQTTGSDFANYASGAPSAGGAATASGYTAGTERTDSDALGRLPHAGGPAASGYTDSMDVDIDGAAGASQGGVSQQQQRGGVSMVAGSMDTAGDDLDDDDDAEGIEEEEGDEDDQEGEEEEEDGDDDESEGEEEDEGYADHGLEDDGLGDVGGDMP